VVGWLVNVLNTCVSQFYFTVVSQGQLRSIWAVTECSFFFPHSNFQQFI
jgi:hypothetical protein